MVLLSGVCRLGLGSGCFVSLGDGFLSSIFVYFWWIYWKFLLTSSEIGFLFLNLHDIPAMGQDVGDMKAK